MVTGFECARNEQTILEALKASFAFAKKDQAENLAFEIFSAKENTMFAIDTDRDLNAKFVEIIDFGKKHYTVTNVHGGLTKVKACGFYVLYSFEDSVQIVIPN